jgi:hypothetical protein
MMDLRSMDKSDRLKEARMQYDSYDRETYRHDYFDEDTGGYLVVEKARTAQGSINKQEMAKYEKELSMCQTLAGSGYQVAYLKMTEGSFDIYLNGTSADLKKTASHNNIVAYAKKAVTKQGAKVVVFEFEKETHHIFEELKLLKAKNIPVKYFFANDKRKVFDL